MTTHGNLGALVVGGHPAPATPTTSEHAARHATPKQRSRELAEIFGREPELISACLQGLAQEPPGRLRLILAAAREALTRYPHYADLHYHASRAAWAAGEAELARMWLERALSIHPGYKDALLLAARVALACGQPQEAEGFLQRALSLGADYPDVHLLRGNAWSRQGDWERARTAYTRALELNPSLSAARTALAELPACPSSGEER